MSIKNANTKIKTNKNKYANILIPQKNSMYTLKFKHKYIYTHRFIHKYVNANIYDPVLGPANPAHWVKLPGTVCPTEVFAGIQIYVYISIYKYKNGQ